MTVVETRWVEHDGLLRSPALSSLGLAAGFTTRALGSMAGGVHPLDEQERNRRALAARLGFTRVIRLRQVHGDRVVQADDAAGDAADEPDNAAGAADPRERWPAADAMWTAVPGLLLGVAAADCVPVLVADAEGPIGAAHAGWRGTTLRVVQALVAAMVRADARLDRLVAAIGPSIGPCCYVIDEARAALVRARLGADAADVLRSEPLRRTAGNAEAGAPDGIWMDLWGANAQQLAQAGVREIELAALCTRCGGADVWSYRGQAGRNGTGLAVIGRPA